MDEKELAAKTSNNAQNTRKTDKSASAETSKKDSRLMMTQAERIAVEMIFRQ